MTRRVLVVAAHPDDEALGCGGTIARHARLGDEVHLLFLADGVGSRYDAAPSAEVAERLGAAREAARHLGVRELTALGLPDNRLDALPLLDVVKPIEQLLESLRPELVYTHHQGDLNVDHRVAHAAVLTACRPAPGQTVRAILCFEVLSSTEWQTPGLGAFAPAVFVEIERDLEAKRRALQAYSGELRPYPHPRSLPVIEALELYRGATAGLGRAEAFTLARLAVGAAEERTPWP